MRVRRIDNIIHIELPPAEARVLLDELSDVRGGAKLPKLKQVCGGLEALFKLDTLTVAQIESQRKFMNKRKISKLLRVVDK